MSKVSIEFPAAPRHCCNMTERLLKIKHNQFANLLLSFASLGKGGSYFKKNVGHICFDVYPCHAE